MATARASGISAQLSLSGSGEGLAAAVDQAAYRVVQEALTNILKHSKSEQAWVRVDYGTERLVVEVVDEGPADPTRSNGSGHGLTGMRERVSLFGGTLDAGPQPGGGFRVHAEIPTGAGRSS